MLAAMAVMLVVAKPATMTYASGKLAGATDLRQFGPKRFRVKEVARFWIGQPSIIRRVRVALAGGEGSVDVHLWGDIDHEWPFDRFEEDLTPPVRLTNRRRNEWHELRLKRRIVTHNSGYMYVGVRAKPGGPQLAVDRKLDHPDKSRYEVVDRTEPRPKQAYWLKPKGDYAVEITTEPLPAKPFLFQDVTRSLGLEQASGSAIAWADVDGDRWEDLLLSGTRLYKNLGGRSFKDVSRGAGLGAAASFGVFADVDRDGDEDLFIGAQEDEGGDRLMLNNGRGQFKKAESKFADGWPSKSATWLDYDLDGRLDLFVANGADGVKTRTRLYRNEGRGRFKLAPTSAINGPKSPIGFFRSASAADLDFDGRSEVAVSTLRLQPDQLWWINGKAAQDRAKRFGFDVDRSPSGKLTGGQGAGLAIGDLDNDARPDIWVANLMHPDWRGYEASMRSSFFLTKGRRAFRRYDAREVGLSFDESPADPTLGDFDNDGDLDAYVGSSYHHGDFYENIGGRFQDATYASGIKTYRGESSAACDFDHDGDLDLALQTKDRGIRLYRNSAIRKSWIQIAFPPKSQTVGASVFVVAGGRRQLRQVIAGKGLGSQDSMVLHFGLGQAKQVDRVEVLLPGGTKQKFTNLSINQRVKLKSN